MERVAAGLAGNEPVLLVGETGTGKTTLLSRVAEMVGVMDCLVPVFYVAHGPCAQAVALSLLQGPDPRQQVWYDFWLGSAESPDLGAEFKSSCGQSQESAAVHCRAGTQRQSFGVAAVHSFPQFPSKIWNVTRQTTLDSVQPLLTGSQPSILPVAYPQVGAKLVAFNLSQQTDSSDLLGGFKPVDVRDALLPLLAPFLALVQRTFSK